MADDSLADLTPNGVALPISARDRERYTPPHYRWKDPEGKTFVPDDAPVYLLGPLTIAERRAVTRATLNATGTFVTTLEIRQCLKDVAREFLEPAEADVIDRDIDELGALETLEGEAADAEETQERIRATANRILKAQSRLSRKAPALRELLAVQMGQLEALAHFTVRACVRGWEHVPARYQRRGGFLTEDATAAIPEEDYEDLCQYCIALREVTREQEPSSASL